MLSNNQSNLINYCLKKVKNEYIRGTLKVVEVSKKIQESRLRWHGHLRTRDGDKGKPCKWKCRETEEEDDCKRRSQGKKIKSKEGQKQEKELRPNNCIKVFLRENSIVYALYIFLQDVSKLMESVFGHQM